MINNYFYVKLVDLPIDDVLSFHGYTVGCRILQLLDPVVL
jgi:hypothetical protein